MQIKKEIFLFCLLIVLSVSLLVASGSSSGKTECPVKKGKTINCCQELQQHKIESPWNFITGGMLHLSV